MNSFRLACFIAGYSYPVLREKSSWSKRKVCILAICLVITSSIWLLNGYLFATTVRQQPPLVGWITGFGAALLIYLVEKAIAMSVGGGWPLITFRVLLAVSVAFIGALGADLSIFKGDIDKDIAILQRNELDSLAEKIDRQQAIRKQELLNEVHEKRQLYRRQTENFRAEISGLGGSGRPGVDSIAKAEWRLAEILKADAIQSEKQLTDFLKQQENAKRLILADARANFKDGLLLRLHLLHKIISRDGIMLFYFAMTTIFFLAIEFLILVFKGSLSLSAYDQEEKKVEEMASEELTRW